MNALFEITAFLLLFSSINSLLCKQSFVMRIAISLALSFVALSLAALGLIWANRFSAILLFGVCLVISFLAYYAATRIHRHIWLNVFGGFRQTDLVDILTMFFCLAVLLLNVRYSSEVVAGRDMGVYTQEAVVFARSGGMNFDVAGNARIRAISGDFIQMGYPGFYSDYDLGTSTNPADITPQFALLFPALLAVGFDAFGFAGLFSINAVLGSLSIFCFYLFLKERAGKLPGFLAAVTLGSTTAQLWNSRVTLTEIFFQLALFTALVIFDLGMKQRNKPLLILSGAVLGITVFIRIDCMLILLGAALYALYLFAVKSDLFRPYLRVFSAFVVVAALGLLFSYFTSRFYVADLWAYGLKDIVVVGIVLSVLVACSFVADGRYPDLRRKLSLPCLAEKIWKSLSFVVVGILMLLFVYFYFLRGVLYENGSLPNVGSLFQAESLKELTWYVPVWLIVLAILSTGLIIQHKDRDTHFLFLLIAYSYIALYIYNPSIYPDHFWASRRWISVTIPAIIAFAYWGMGMIFTNRKKIQSAVLLGLAVPTIAFNYIQSDLIFHNPMYQNLSAEMAAALENFPPDQPVFTDNPEIASAARYVYNRDVYLLSRGLSSSVELIAIGKEFGTFYFLGDFDYIQTIANPRVVDKKTLLISSFFPEKATNVYPSRIDQKTFNLSLYKLIYDPTQKSGDYVFFDIGNSESENLKLVDGFGSSEISNNGEDFRWTDGDGKLIMKLNDIDFVEQELEISLRMRNFGDISDATVIINGTPFLLENVTSDFTDFTFTIPAEVVDDRPNMELALISPTTSPYDLGISQDKRQLGLCVDWIILETVDNR